MKRCVCWHRDINHSDAEDDGLVRCYLCKCKSFVDGPWGVSHEHRYAKLRIVPVCECGRELGE